VVPAALLPVSPPLPPPSTSVDTSPTDIRVNQQSAEIKRVSDELITRNRMCEALQLELRVLTADLDKARLKISEQEYAMEKLTNELATSKSELESTIFRLSRELADKDALLLTARHERDAAVGQIDSVNRVDAI
jgi:predicted  nucleic acid-binding Zn-ribbon protein